MSGDMALEIGDIDKTCRSKYKQAEKFRNRIS